MNQFDPELCARCKGRGWCNGPCIVLQRVKQYLPKTKLHFSGSSPPEIFVGREGYPNVNTGILSPQYYGDTEEMSMPEIWHARSFPIEKILNNRGQLIYSRFKSRIIDARKSSKFLDAMREISLSDKSVSTEVHLKNPAKVSINFDQSVPIIGNPAPLKKIRIEENPHIDRKVDYISSDTDNKAANSIKALYKLTEVSNIIKILSAGMLGLKDKRKLVPTRWAVTATDDTISKSLLEKIRYYPEISEVLLFNAEYVGNHYEFLLLPDKFSFEVIEAKMSGSVWNPFSTSTVVMQDNEGFNGRKNYASNVTGAYYSNRLALCEYLEKTKRQASCLVMRECRPEYYAPLGTGILRETSREAFAKLPERFNTIEEALTQAQSRMKLPTPMFKQRSQLLKEYKRQTRLSKWF
jgi:DNA repair protein NreA